jgi:hypothetical protein
MRNNLLSRVKCLKTKKNKRKFSRVRVIRVISFRIRSIFKIRLAPNKFFKQGKRAVLVNLFKLKANNQHRRKILKLKRIYTLNRLQECL